MLRVLILAMLIGMVSTGVANERSEDEPSGAAGMRGFGRLIGVLTVIGAVLLALLVLAGVLSLFDVFGHEYADPPV